ncbi:OmpH family outer membrane protein [Vibrio parahaemolyticus]|nr:OmpH family outer membrane protein [Vibrio parahaemolyticus]KIT46460.1 hypothetical protein H337_07000 [Vibrio parahaemolyticus EN9701121]KKX73769.1 hypothetical protein UF37_23635 [Vibrio parahaemolyticus]KYY15794.1 hypothetical protein AWQ06_22000 [Vibrio parahaemolyticus]KYY35528.1 hypothetical protein AWQ07_13870 [Vibrio parahaemolyticus]
MVDESFKMTKINKVSFFKNGSKGYAVKLHNFNNRTKKRGYKNGYLDIAKLDLKETSDSVVNYRSIVRYILGNNFKDKSTLNVKLRVLTKTLKNKSSGFSHIGFNETMFVCYDEDTGRFLVTQFDVKSNEYDYFHYACIAPHHSEWDSDVTHYNGMEDLVQRYQCDLNEYHKKESILSIYKKLSSPMVSFVVDDVRKKQIEAVNNAVQVNTVSYELKLKQLEEKYESKLKALESENDELRKLFDNADYYLELESKFDDVNDKMFEVSKIATEKGYSGILDAVNSLIEIDITDNEKVALSDSIDLVDNNHAGGCVNSLDIIINHKLDANKPPAELFDDKCQQCNSGVINTHELLEWFKSNWNYLSCEQKEKVSFKLRNNFSGINIGLLKIDHEKVFEFAIGQLKEYEEVNES